MVRWSGITGAGRVRLGQRRGHRAGEQPLVAVCHPPLATDVGTVPGKAGGMEHANGQVESRYRLTTILAMGCTRRGVLCARCDHLLNWFRTRYTFSWIPRASFGQRMEMYFHNLQLLRCGTTMRIF